MTELKVGVVDVYLIDPTTPGWQVLLLRRGAGTRCTGAWEGVHGRIESGETPESAALREVREETSLTIERLYNVTCQPFYLHRLQTVQVAVVFAAFVAAPVVPVLGEEHDASEWLPYDHAIERVIWPRSRHALRDIRELLAGGDAGPVEDVMRVM
jgi:8-oxo-dGTP pyrophosphatase MutT (NUDIX family)